MKGEIEIMKKFKKIVLSLIVAAVLFGLLFAQLQQASGEKIEYTEVVSAKVKIQSGSKIAKEDVELKKVPVGVISNGIEDLNLVVDKYAKDTLYAGQYVLDYDVKSAQSNSIGPDIREVRVITNIAAYGGVGKGDKVDLIYVGKINALTDSIGKLLYEGLEVKNVLNRSGVDLEAITSDKYNQADVEPGYVSFWVNQEMAIEIETLQGMENDVVIKLAKWVDSSEATEQDHGVMRKEDILFNGNGVPKEYQEQTIGAVKDISGSKVQTSGNGEAVEIGGDGR